MQVTPLQDVNIYKVKHYELDIDHINSLLKQDEKELLPAGSIEDLGPTYPDLRIYVFKFSKTATCSDTNSNVNKEVIMYDDPADYITFPNGVTRNIGWSFYSLVGDARFDIEQHFVSRGSMYLKDNFIYPEPESEDERMDVLLKTIEQHYDINKHDSGIDAKRIHSGSYHNECHCEFTGGGDIFIKKKGRSVSITNIGSVPISPVHETEAISSLVIEGKKSDSVTKQVIANTILCCVTQFVAGCKKRERDANFLKKCIQISSYGIAYTGMGYVSFCKLTMVFNKYTSFDSKIKPGVYQKQVSAAIVDAALDHFFMKAKQDTEEH